MRDGMLRCLAIPSFSKRHMLCYATSSSHRNKLGRYLPGHASHFLGTVPPGLQYPIPLGEVNNKRAQRYRGRSR
jgi:hypothetical protein